MSRFEPLYISISGLGLWAKLVWPMPVASTILDGKGGLTYLGYIYLGAQVMYFRFHTWNSLFRSRLCGKIPHMWKKTNISPKGKSFPYLS